MSATDASGHGLEPVAEVDRAVQAGPSAEAGISGDAGRPRIAVVDDEHFFREAMVEILSTAGWNCLEAEDGEGALRCAGDRRVGVVLLDLRLPDGNGIEVLERLLAERPELAVIALASSSDQELVLEALRKGACDYLAKPLHDEELLLSAGRGARVHALARGSSELRERIQRLVAAGEALQRAGEAAGDPSLFYQAAAQAAADALGAGKTSLMLVDEDEGLAPLLRVEAVLGRWTAPEEMDPCPVGEGVAGVVVESGEPLWVEAVGEDARFADLDRQGRYQSGSFVVAPLLAGERAVGALCATDREDGEPFDLQDLGLLRVLASIVGSRLARPAEEKQELPAAGGETADPLASLTDPLPLSGGPSDHDADLMREICDALTDEVEPERVLRAALEPILRSLHARSAAVYLYDNAGSRLLCEAALPGPGEDREALPADLGLAGSVFQAGHLVAATEPDRDPRFVAEVDTPADGVAVPMLCLPLQLRGKVIGIARVFLPSGADPSPRTGEMLSAGLSAAVRNVLLYRSLLQSIEEVAEVRRESRQG